MRNLNWLIPVLLGEILILVGLLMKVLNFGSFVQIAILVALLWYAGETRSMKKATEKSTKYLEYQTRPTAYFLIVSSKALEYTDGKTLLFIKNGSKFKILFYVKITLKSGNKICTLDNYWVKNNPLHVYPGQGHMQFPDVIKLDGFSEAERRSIIAEVEYEIAPSHVPLERYKDYYKEEWKYDGKSWRGPNGLPEISVVGLLSSKKAS